MEDYRLDQRVDAQHHPAVVKRLTESPRALFAASAGNCQGGRSMAGATQIASEEHYGEGTAET